MWLLDNFTLGLQLTSCPYLNHTVLLSNMSQGNQHHHMPQSQRELSSWGVRQIPDNLLCWSLGWDEPGEAGTFFRCKRGSRNGVTISELTEASGQEEPWGRMAHVQPHRHPPFRERAKSWQAPDLQEQVRKRHGDTNATQTHSEQQGQESNLLYGNENKKRSTRPHTCLELKIHPGVYQRQRNGDLADSS